MDTRFDCGSWCFTVLDPQKDGSALDFAQRRQILYWVRVLAGLVSARLHILVTVRRCAIIGNKQFELRPSEVVNGSVDEASDGNEFKKYQQSKSPMNSADEPSATQQLWIRFQRICVAVVISHVTGHGVKGQALQCDLCECWYHAMCENFGSKQ